MPSLNANHPITVVGSGFVGTLAALMLSRQGLPIRIIDPLTISEHMSKPTDGRAISITMGSKAIFEEMGLWNILEPHAQPLTNIYTLDASGAEMHLSTNDLEKGPLGYMLDSKILKDTLLRQVYLNTKIDYIPDKVTNIHYVEPFDHAAELTLQVEEPVQTSLIIGADGSNSTISKILNLRTHRWSYDQTAFVRIYQHENLHEGRAYEKFLSTGPFAILPLPQNRSSIVWMMPNKIAEKFFQMDQEDFDKEAFKHMKEYTAPTPISPIWHFPIKGLWVPNFTSNRVALIGDASHVIHPLAGQGFNLGIQDAHVLSTVIGQGLSLGLDLGSRALLQNYERRQRNRHLTLLGATDGLNHLFSNENATLKWIRSNGLKAIESLPTMKQFFAEKGTGLARKKAYPAMSSNSRALN